MREYLIFLPVCIFVNGYERSAILDWQRGILDFIPNEMYEIFRKYDKCKLNDILQNYNAEEQEIVLEYVDFLIKNEYAIIGSEKDIQYFVDLPLDFNYAGYITNCICEYSDFTRDNIQLILSQVDGILNCSALQIICNREVSIQELSKFLQNFVDITFLNHLEFILPYSSEYKNINDLLWKNTIINRLIFYSSPFEKVINMEHSFVIYTCEDLKEKCGVVDKFYFTQNIFHITEALHHNTCLNRKIYIDKEGNIKNCPFFHKIYGNIMKDDVKEIISTPSFQKFWNIKKDEIKVCKDCEFRYICTDCRVFIKDKNDIYSQPEKCSYNPYIAKWEGEEGYYSVEEFLKNSNENVSAI